MISQIIKRNGINYGVVTGIVLSLITAAVYAIDIELFLSFWTTLLSLSAFIIITVILLMQTKKQVNNQLSFKEAFTAYFICSLIGIALLVGFKMLLFNIIDPSLKDTLLELTVKYLRDEKPQVTIKYSEISNFLSKALSI